MTETRIGRALLSGITCGVMALVAVPTADLPAQEAGHQVTYARDVAPILQEKCQICHQPNSVAPMSLLTLFQGGQRELDIPPGQVSVTQNFHVLQAPARLENFQPHMHMRGKAMSMEAIYPDGRKELLSSVDNFQWQ